MVSLLPVAEAESAVENSNQKPGVPQAVREKFRKTRMCRMFQEGRCFRGTNCQFAHCETEMSTAPDLSKTKLCFNFFRQACTDADCKFAHGYHELRATDGVFKTGICHGWKAGKCRFGSSCRFAHGDDELRMSAQVERNTPVAPAQPQMPQPQVMMQMQMMQPQMMQPQMMQPQMMQSQMVQPQAMQPQLMSPMMQMPQMMTQFGQVCVVFAAPQMAPMQMQVPSPQVAEGDDGKSKRWSDEEEEDVQSTSTFVACKGEDSDVASGDESTELDSDNEVSSTAGSDSAASNLFETRTTLKLSGLPTGFTRDSLLNLFAEEGVAKDCDFIYLPTNFKSPGSCYGYAFANFATPEATLQAKSSLESHHLDVAWANSQGLQEHVDRFRNSPVMHESVPDGAKPALFCDGVRVTFPPPTRHIFSPGHHGSRRCRRDAHTL